MAKSKISTEQSPESPESQKKQSSETAVVRKGLKPGFVKLELVVPEDVDVRLYRAARNKKMSKSAMGGKLLNSALSKLAIDRKPLTGDAEIPCEDGEAA